MHNYIWLFLTFTRLNMVKINSSDLKETGIAYILYNTDKHQLMSTL